MKFNLEKTWNSDELNQERKFDKNPKSPRAGPGSFGPGRLGPITHGPRPARPETGPGRPGPDFLQLGPGRFRAGP